MNYNTQHCYMKCKMHQCEVHWLALQYAALWKLMPNVILQRLATDREGVRRAAGVGVVVGTPLVSKLTSSCWRHHHPHPHRHRHCVIIVTLIIFKSIIILLDIIIIIAIPAIMWLIIFVNCLNCLGQCPLFYWTYFCESLNLYFSPTFHLLLCLRFIRACQAAFYGAVSRGTCICRRAHFVFVLKPWRYLWTRRKLWDCLASTQAQCTCTKQNLVIIMPSQLLEEHLQFRESTNVVFESCEEMKN